jgi:IS605 OrfB family transposase
MMEEVRAVALNALPLTGAKEEKLNNLLDSCIQGTEYLLAALSYMKLYGEKWSRYKLQDKTYEYLRKTFSIPAQITVDLIKDVFAMNNSFGFSQYSISYNNPRSGRLSETQKGNPIMSIAIPIKKRIGIPIAQDGAWHRFNELVDSGYSWTAFKITKSDTGWKRLISLKKKFAIIENHSIIGIDVGSRCLAAITLVTDSGIEKQLYFGRDIYDKQRDISIRRSKLQQYRDTGTDKEKARQKLTVLKSKEHDYVKTRCYQIAHEIAEIAKAHKSVIAIENLKGLRNARGHRKSNRRTKRMPYRTFRAALESVATRAGIEVMLVSPRYTSQWCPKCGKLGKRKNKGKTFVCECGREVNADRGASLNIALRAASIRNHNVLHSQYSQGSVPVNARGWHDEGKGVMSWHGYFPPECKPLCFSLG